MCVYVYMYFFIYALLYCLEMKLTKISLSKISTGSLKVSCWWQVDYPFVKTMFVRRPTRAISDVSPSLAKPDEASAVVVPKTIRETPDSPLRLWFILRFQPCVPMINGGLSSHARESTREPLYLKHLRDAKQKR